MPALGRLVARAGADPHADRHRAHGAGTRSVTIRSPPSSVVTVYRCTRRTLAWPGRSAAAAPPTTGTWPRGARLLAVPPPAAVAIAPPPPPPRRAVALPALGGGVGLGHRDQLLGRDLAAVLVLGHQRERRSGRGPCRPRPRSTRTMSPRVSTCSAEARRLPLGRIRLTCSRPSTPLRSSTKAPKSAILTTSPSSYSSPTSIVLGHRVDAPGGRLGQLAVGAVDADRAVLLDVDLHLVLGLAGSGSSRRPCRSPCRCSRDGSWSTRSAARGPPPRSRGAEIASRMAPRMNSRASRAWPARCAGSRW